MRDMYGREVRPAGWAQQAARATVAPAGQMIRGAIALPVVDPFYGFGFAARPWVTAVSSVPVPAPLVALGDMHVSCSQWLALTPATQASLVRGVLEARGFASLNSISRGEIVYKLVSQISAYCGAQVAIATAPAWYVDPFGIRRLVADGSIVFENQPRTEISPGVTVPTSSIPKSGAKPAGRAMVERYGVRRAARGAWGGVAPAGQVLPFVWTAEQILSMNHLSCAQWGSLSASDKNKVVSRYVGETLRTTQTYPGEVLYPFDYVGRTAQVVIDFITAWCQYTDSQKVQMRAAMASGTVSPNPGYNGPALPVQTTGAPHGNLVGGYIPQRFPFFGK
jgi:hypothetical protein